MIFNKYFIFCKNERLNTNRTSKKNFVITRSKQGDKEKIGALYVVTACSQFIKHNRKHSRVSNTRK